ncbi:MULTISPECIES: ABC transporter permease [Sciscionella]|uniref:ABC transporter permease n=1 Tax=Sciscionella TaxID=596495 RepID=UPI000475827E|nr:MULTISPECIES: ABC transporter permease [Sciscionella]
MTTTDSQNGRESRSPRSPREDYVELSLSGALGKVRTAVGTGGEIAKFSGRTVRSFGDLRHFVPEIFHQTGIIILSSGLIIWLMQFVIGYECGLEGKYVLDQIGAPLYSGVFNAWCLLREMSPYMYGYIFAAKVGCGLVAEIGSMRISDEIDALEVMGVKSRSYLVGTRVVAAWLAIPFLFVVGLGISFIGGYLVTVQLLGGVSSGGYSFIFWLFQNPLDLLYALIKVILMATAIIFVGCYYGYNAGGGPVGVGRNTARSMMLNMVLVHVIAFLSTQLLWGGNVNAPVAN